MKIPSGLMALLALSMTHLPLLAQDPAVTREAEVQAVARSFHAALAGGDSLQALALLTDDVIILEGGRAETKQQYRSGHLRADIAYASAVKKENLSEAATITGDVALYTGQSRTSGRYRERDIDRTSAEAMILIRTPEGWRIRHIHWP